MVLGEGLQKGKKLTREIAVFTLLSAGPFLKAPLVFLRAALLVRVASCLGVSAYRVYISHQSDCRIRVCISH